MSEIGHNSTVNADQLKSIIERVENLKAQSADISTDISEVYKEARGNGFDAAVIKEIVKRRAKDPDKRHEFESVLDTYLTAIGGM